MSSHPKHARADHEVLEVIRHRWSPRAFDPGRPVPRAELLRLFEAARWAPSSFNAQPWRFVVSMRDSGSESHQQLLASLTGKNPAWAGAAPVLILVALRATIDLVPLRATIDLVPLRATLEANEAPNNHAWYDTGQAVAFLTLQATSQGLALRQMEGFDRERARTACNVPGGFDPAVIIALGYTGDPGTLMLDKHRAAETSPRERRPAGEFVFDGVWGSPFADQLRT